MTGTYPSFFTRLKVKRLAWFFASLTIALVVFNQYEQYRLSQSVQSERSDRKAYVDQQLQLFACVLVLPYPDSAAPLVKYLRDKYKCAPYDVDKVPPIFKKHASSVPTPTGAVPSATGVQPTTSLSSQAVPANKPGAASAPGTTFIPGRPTQPVGSRSNTARPTATASAQPTQLPRPTRPVPVPSASRTALPNPVSSIVRGVCGITKICISLAAPRGVLPTLVIVTPNG